MRKLFGLLAVLLTLTNTAMAEGGTSAPPAASTTDANSKVILGDNGQGYVNVYKLSVGSNGTTGIVSAPDGHYTLPDGRSITVVEGKLVP